MSWRDFNVAIVAEPTTEEQRKWSWIVPFCMAAILLLISILFVTDNQTVSNAIYGLFSVALVGLLLFLFFAKDTRKETGRFLIADDTITVTWNDSTDRPEKFNLSEVKQITIYSSPNSIRTSGYQFEIVDNNGKHTYLLNYGGLQQTENLNHIISLWVKNKVVAVRIFRLQ